MVDKEMCSVFFSLPVFQFPTENICHLLVQEIQQFQAATETLAVFLRAGGLQLCVGNCFCQSAHKRHMNQWRNITTTSTGQSVSRMHS